MNIIKKFFATFCKGLVVFFVLASPLKAQSYCDNGSSTDQYLWIDAISFNDFFHYSGTNFGYGGDQDYIYQGYKDYTHMQVIAQSESNLFSLVSAQSLTGYDVFWSLWIDLNQDAVFADDERLISESGSMGIDIPLSFLHLDLNAPLTTRMRIGISYFVEPAACGPITGEVEDYTITILPPEPEIPNTLRVPEDHPTIQSAIDSAESNDVVLVNDGTYDEQVVVDKPLVIRSVNGSEHTKVLGAVDHMTFAVQSPDVTIQGFGLTGAYGGQYAGIYFAPGSHRGKALENSCFLAEGVQRNDVGVLISEADDVIVSGLVCDHDDNGNAGIWAENSNGGRFINNTLNHHFMYGMYMSQVTDVTIENNITKHNLRDGVYITDSEALRFVENVFSDNNHGAPGYTYGNGLSVFNSNNVLVEANEFDRNGNKGIGLLNVENVMFTNNQISTNANIEVFLRRSRSLTVKNNRITGNEGQFTKSGIVVSDCSDYVLENNVFLYGLSPAVDLSGANGGEIFGNSFLSDRWAMSIRNSIHNVIHGNQFQIAVDTRHLCQIRLSDSEDISFYLNQFNMEVDRIACSVDSTSGWYSSEVIDYIYQGELYSNHLGNFYLNNPIDLDGDGVGHSSVTIIPEESVDDYPLSDGIHAYEVLEQ